MNELDRFLDFAESLKLVRNSTIENFLGESDIDDIYTDLLPNNGILKKINLPRTTILVGRKGTGKSTIFQKSQKDLVENKNAIPIYVDVKSLYDSSTPDLPISSNDQTKEFHKYLIYNNFIRTLVLEVKNKLEKFIKGSFIENILGFTDLQKNNIYEELNSIEDSIENVVKNVDMSLSKSIKKIEEKNNKDSSNINAKLSASPSISADISSASTNLVKKELESILVTYLDIKKGLISNLIRIKDILQVDHLYIYLDDYSEIDKNAQILFMDWFIAPLNNLSEDFVKFKIAVYPNRFYYGKLDNSKIDEISLDFFDAFYNFEKKVDISKMEILALDYTKRLLNKRFELFFSQNQWSSYFSLKDSELFDLLFSLTFNIPRKIGYILSYCYESSLIHGVRIGVDALENAAQRFYKDVTLKYFIANQFVLRPFEDVISIEHQFELVNRIIDRQKKNADQQLDVNLGISPANHFTVNNTVSSLLDNLELNGFLSTYNQVNVDRDEILIIYSLDFGLCKSNGLEFRRAFEPRILDYFSHPIFNMNVLIADYFNNTQIYLCPSGHDFPFHMKENLQLFGFRCPICIDENISQICELTVSNIDLKERLRQWEDSKKQGITYNEFQILDYLKTIGKTVSINKISNATDKSVSNSRFKLNRLIERELIELDEGASELLKKDLYKLTGKGDKLMNKLYKLLEDAGKK